MSGFSQESTNFLKGAIDGSKYAKNYLNDISSYLGSMRSMNVNISGSTASIGYKIMQNQASQSPRPEVGFLDMKPIYARSAKRKIAKDGGWYLTIPIKGHTTELRSAYSRSVWDDISHMSYGSTSNGGVNPKVLQKKLGTSQWGVNQALKYQWKSSNITRVPWGSSGSRANYISFRTVSSKSSPSSWIIGRKNFTTRTVPNQYANQISNILRNNISAT